LPPVFVVAGAQQKIRRRAGIHRLSAQVDLWTVKRDRVKQKPAATCIV
jgi:hypothetical protein